MSKSNKVMPSQKVSPPNGPIGTYRQTTAPNPSQANGMTPPKIPSVQRDLGEISPTDYDRNGRP